MMYRRTNKKPLHTAVPFFNLPPPTNQPAVNWFNWFAQAHEQIGEENWEINFIFQPRLAYSHAHRITVYLVKQVGELARH